jgi:hypothetical protein
MLLALLLTCILASGPTPSLLAGNAALNSSAPPPDPRSVFQRLKHLTQLGVDHWHALRQRGQGVKIAVLDSGFRGYKQHLGKALPSHVTVRSFRGDGNLEAKDSQHGILCAEVLHAVAPDAELLFANWEPERSDQFLDAVRWARGQGARILSCSVIMPSWSDGEGGGAVHDSLRWLLGDGSHRGDAICFASAGNTAQRHWSGPFHPGAEGWHEWSPSICDNEISPWGTDRVSIEMCWNADADFELCVLDALSKELVGRSSPQPGVRRSCAVVRFDPRDDRSYVVRLRQTRGPRRPFHFVCLGGGLAYSTSHSSIPFPGDGPEVIAVGAVDAEGQRVAYSSCGPTSTHPKPDLVATVPFPSLWRPRPFSGTSAAAPQAAGLAALVWARHPAWNANQIRDSLCKSALDLGPVGHDPETGYGLIRLPN